MRLRRGSDGFTLVELLVAIVILGIITVPLTSVVIGFFRSADATTGRLIESHDVQIASTYWSQDVASIGKRSTAGVLDQSVWQGASGLCPSSTATGMVIASLAWDEFSAPGVKSIVQVAYVVKPAPGQIKLTELHRLTCKGSALVSDLTVARDLDPLTPPALGCSATCTASPAVPKSVTLTLAIKDPMNLGGAYVVRLTGQRRQS